MFILDTIHRLKSQLEKQLGQEQQKYESISHALALEQEDKAREMEEKNAIEVERAREKALREELEGYLEQAKYHMEVSFLKKEEKLNIIYNSLESIFMRINLSKLKINLNNFRNCRLSWQQ